MNNTRTNVLPQGMRLPLAVSLGSLYPRFSHQVSTWCLTNGVEWTVKRMKVLRSCALKLRGQMYDYTTSEGSYKLPVMEVIQLYRENSIAYNHKTLIPKGIYGEVVRLFVASRKPVVTRSLDVALRAYTGLYLRETSWTQFKKAEKSINGKPTYTKESMEEAIEIMLKGWSYLRKQIPKDLFAKDGALKVGKPNLHRIHPFTSTHCSEQWEDPFGKGKVAIPYSKWVASFCSNTAWPKAFRTSTEAAEWDPDWKGLYAEDIFVFTRSLVFHSKVDNDYTGHIAFIQEGGAKGRIVATPSAKLQWAFQPLHEALDRVLSYLPQVSVVHDQNNGAYWILRHLGKDYGIGSIDLQSSTDRFPAELQYALLDALKLSKWADAFREVCSDDWLAIAPNGKKRVWHYECGQPMGLYSSFPLFALTYTCFVMGLALDLLERPYPNFRRWVDQHGLDQVFMNLGDDIIVATTVLAKYLKLWLGKLGCGISEDKTFISQRVAEFAGFIAFQTNQGVTTYRPYKHSRKSLRNGVGFIHAVGDKLLRAESTRRSKYWAEKLSLYKRSLGWRFPDLSPVVSMRLVDVTPNEEYIDIVRLTNLLNANLLYNPNEGRGPRVGDTYTGEEYSLYRIEDLAAYLLNQEVSDDTVFESRAVLSPGMDISLAHRREELYGAKTNISTDPLMKSENLDLLETPITTIPQHQEVIPKSQDDWDLGLDGWEIVPKG